MYPAHTTSWPQARRIAAAPLSGGRLEALWSYAGLFKPRVVALVLLDTLVASFRA